LSQQDLEPYIQPFMEKLGAKMQSNDVKVQKKAILFVLGLLFRVAVDLKP